MIRRPPRSTLLSLHDALPIFPSHRDLPLEPRIARVDHVEEQRRLERFVEGRLERCDQPVRQVLDEADRVADEHARDGGRKSTRLNSSHQILSYALFSFTNKHI